MSIEKEKGGAWLGQGTEIAAEALQQLWPVGNFVCCRLAKAKFVELTSKTMRTVCVELDSTRAYVNNMRTHMRTHIFSCAYALLKSGSYC